MYIVTAEPRRSVNNAAASIPRRSSTWTRKCGLSRTSIPTIAAASCGRTTSTGWRIAIVRCPMRKSRSIRSSASSLSAQRHGCAVHRGDHVLPAGMETQERECWYINMGAVDGVLHHGGDGEDVRSRPHVGLPILIARRRQEHRLLPAFFCLGARAVPAASSSADRRRRPPVPARPDLCGARAESPAPRSRSPLS